MKLTTKQLQKHFNVDYYDGSIIHDRFAYKVFRNTVSPLGNIIAFRSKCEVTDNLIDLEDALKQDYIYSDDMVHFCYEIPNLPLFGGVCFQRLFNTYIGGLLGEIIQSPVEVDGDDIFVKQPFTRNGTTMDAGKASVSIVGEKNGALLGHVGINVSAGNTAPVFAYSTNMTDEQVDMFIDKVCEQFVYMLRDIFVATTKIVL